METGTEPTTAESIEKNASVIRAKLYDLETEMFGQAKICKTGIAWTFPDGKADDTERLEFARVTLSHTVGELLQLIGLAKQAVSRGKN